ncbi:hypothetical protein D9615_008750 [Tricholomella constricta]|uniref:CCHC-type domain-containing protein n=1 Tax=Tricholomella constricta TaxID=117010 RepID=A0A8H5H7T2_9AGAR|nr:hypothetical protein D9615_008750 [Tricholomella constricta]
MAATSNSSGKGKSKFSKPRGACWNCGKIGHYKHKCPEPPKTDKSEKTKTSGTANAAESDSEDDAFAVHFEESDEEDSVPSLQAVSDSSSCAGDESDSDEDDWFSEVGSDCNDLQDSAWDSTETAGSGASDAGSFSLVDGSDTSSSMHGDDFAVEVESFDAAAHVSARGDASQSVLGRPLEQSLVVLAKGNPKLY